ncbi:mammalian cell entry protein [Mycolicibacterium litorale]|uniref:Mammalian cell entry protein n=1 Tax=Mycolicibacterium litorale TaxID=758802 RepID=A0A6S6P050_9MYCO|nr:mammalian cell entry protein [Mycolicibacterium litorale]BCI50851.1 mammalian cell entry protein [Mycolicibacterium litorale]
MEDQPADSGDLTTDPATTPRKRRWLPMRRTKTAPRQVNTAPDVPAPDVPAGDVTADPAPRVPTGKARRTPTPTPTADEPPAPEPESPEPENRETAEAEPDAAQTDAAEPDAVESGGDSAAEPEPEPEPEPVLVAHRPAGRRLLTAAAAASVLFVGAAAFAGATLQPYLADRAAVDTKLAIARTAAEAITTLWSYTPEDMATLPDRSSRYLAGDFATEYRRYIDAIVSTNEQAKVTNSTQVMGTAVESLTPTEATALVYTNSVSTSPVSKNVPSLRYLSYRLTMERDGSNWLITSMNAVTKLDLTPQL